MKKVQAPRLAETADGRTQLPDARNKVSSDKGESRPGTKRRRTISVVLMAVTVVAAVAGAYYYGYTQSFQSTDDAFIEGDITDLAPKVAGRVEAVLIGDNQFVKKEDLLVTIDPRDYDAALRQKQASLDSFKAQAAAVEATIEQQQAHLETLASTEQADQATAQAERANAVNAAALLKRNQELFARGDSS